MNMSNLVRGAAVGVAAGCVTCLLSGSKRRHHRTRGMQKKAEHAMKTIGTAMEELADMMK